MLHVDEGNLSFTIELSLHSNGMQVNMLARDYCDAAGGDG